VTGLVSGCEVGIDLIFHAWEWAYLRGDLLQVAMAEAFHFERGVARDHCFVPMLIQASSNRRVRVGSF
jgi:hypothetical protein